MSALRTTIYKTHMVRKGGLNRPLKGHIQIESHQIMQITKLELPFWRFTYTTNTNWIYKLLSSSIDITLYI